MSIWIESHQDLEEHPKLLYLCQKTGWSLDEAIGKLHRLWWWTLKYAEDGDLSKYDPGQFLVRLNSKLSPEEFYKVLQDAKFIDKTGLVHDWLDYAGRYLSTKYRTSNPKLLEKIERKHKSNKRQTKDRLKTDFSPPTLPTLPKEPKEPNNTDFPFLAQLLKTLILKNKPDRKLGTNWERDTETEIRLMVERDKRSQDRIREVIEFSQYDQFWKMNILSGAKLRKQYDQLEDKMRNDKSWQEHQHTQRAIKIVEQNRNKPKKSCPHYKKDKCDKFKDLDEINYRELPCPENMEIRETFCPVNRKILN